MRIKYLTKITILSIFFISLLSNAFSKINSSIIVKVGNEIVTNGDLENEIRTMLILSNRKINQENVDMMKSVAVNSLIKNLIKKNEVKKKNIEKYNPDELESYLLMVSKKLRIKRSDLKNLFLKNNLDYSAFIEKNKVELMWRTLIYSLYKNQLNVNTIEVENEFKNRIQNKEIEYELSEIEISTKNKKIDELLKNIYQTIKTDGFETAARKFSISNSASQGGKIGIFLEKTLSNTYLLELKKIKLGEVTKPIKNLDSLVILKIESINLKEKKDLDFDEIKKQIITKKKEEKLDLFSRSHFTNLENITLIKFQ